MDYHTADFVNALKKPSRAFGEVPYYWWNGDKLDKKRLTSQLEALSEKGLAGVQVNYAHLYGGGENSLPHGGFGASMPGSPYQYSDEWWKFFSYAAGECERLGMSIGVGDYTVAWPGNGFFVDSVSKIEGMHAHCMQCVKKMFFAGDETSAASDESILAIISFADADCEKPIVIYEKGKDSVDPIPSCCISYVITLTEQPNSIDPLNPECGKALVKLYFEEFERRLPDLKPGTLNFFFQDELMFGADVKTLWRDNLRVEVKKKYGYDILGFLPHLFFNLGNITAKIRLNVSDVRTSLIEEGYFKPIYAFHSSRGLIYGCDQPGRGRQPDEYSDYFRTIRWFTAPGNDTPGRAADLIKVKVNSSVAHLYRRPRVWLEGYHSSGWGTTLESITAPTSDNFIFGANLLNLHGLYYTTDGGFFEWAPPDFHFRMPYWDDEKAWLDKYKRMSALLTTGHHECDAAVFYPVSSCDYGENSGECTELTFRCGEYLFCHGVDFDFIDFQSIENSVCSDARMKSAEEKYKVLIFAGVDCIRYSLIAKIKAFLDCGGIVAFCGITPYASDRAGLNDDVLKDDILDILSHPNCFLAASENELLTFINKKVKRSFLPESLPEGEKTYVHKRIHGKDCLYFVRYAPKDSVCRFEATGEPYLLDTDSGEIIKLTGTISQEGFSFIKMPLDANRDTLILFTDEKPDADGEINTAGYRFETEKKRLELDRDWEFSLLPTLDNTYGDFYIPSGGLIGAEARFFDVSRVSSDESIPSIFEFTSLPYCHSMGLKRIECQENPSGLCSFIALSGCAPREGPFIFGGKQYEIEIPELHDRYGYICREDEDSSLVEQGWHGLKGKVYDDNIFYDSSCVYFTYISAEKDENAFLLSGCISPDVIYLNGKQISTGEIRLKKGKNFLCAAFSYKENSDVNFRNSRKIRRTSLFVVKDKETAAEKYPLAVSSFADKNFFSFSGKAENGNIFCFRFVSVPGFYRFEANLFGTLLSAYNNGEKMELAFLGCANFGGKLFSAEADNADDGLSEVVFFVKADGGTEYTGIIPEPVKLFCKKGRVDCGDLSHMGALKNYSGKAVYEKTTKLEKINTDERFYLDIADAGATLNIEINGRTAAVLTYPPFKTDITDYVVNGENRIKITVSNTLCNHYSTIPSRYSNFPADAKSGLIGPVSIVVTEK